MFKKLFKFLEKECFYFYVRGIFLFLFSSLLFTQDGFSSIQDDLSKYSLVQALKKPPTAIESFTERSHFYTPSTITSDEKRKQGLVAKLLITALDNISDKKGAFQTIFDATLAEFNKPALNENWVHHCLALTGILGVYVRFEVDLDLKGNGDKLLTAMKKHQVFFDAIMAQATGFKSNDKNYRLGSDGWLGTYGQLICERYGIAPILFHKENEENGEFSNFYPSSFADGTYTYTTSEHYFQAHKYPDGSVNFKGVLACGDSIGTKFYIRDHSLEGTDPGVSKWRNIINSPTGIIAQLIKYDSSLENPAYKDIVMANALFLKFSQLALQKKLLSTGRISLVENTILISSADAKKEKTTQYDGYWGNDFNDQWNKKPYNKLGRLLMALRRHFQEETKNFDPFEWITRLDDPK